MDLKKIRELSKKPLSQLLKEVKDAKKIELALAACCAAAEEALKLTPFDEQLRAALSLYNGKIAEMKTGEGKTMAAVFAAYLLKLDNRKVHIFTFNDYLAKRDYNWQGPLYKLLGINVELITAETPTEARREIYKNADVVYCTVKECGFDFLRDFTVFETCEKIHCYKFEGSVEADSDTPFDFAIFDEADSVLIDEARLPLVIAGDVDFEADENLAEVCEFVKSFETSDYVIDAGEMNAYLTDKGIQKTEERYNLENLYDEENADLLITLNTCLKAVFYLKENKDYIVKDNEIRLIDALTGRVALNRVLPSALQSAVEMKHGLKITERGVVTGIIPIQYFARQYRNIAGMTGTAMQADEEFELLYGLHVDVIPPRIPSNRVANPNEVYYDAETKLSAIVSEVAKAHEKNQPVLIGTSTIEDSEKLATALEKDGIKARVLNAKNDEMEAEIIKDAGAIKSVTVSTNMSGRGVDIKLGGFGEETRAEALKAGGLYIIGTALYENARMNEQLNGRCGRQGDVGETKLFLALDDEIMVRRDLKKLVGARRYPDKTTEEIKDKVVLREIERIQRISQGELLEERKRLLKFTIIGEKHRKIIFKKRLEYLNGETEPNIWQEYSKEEYKRAAEKFGEEALNALQKEVILSAINEIWRDYLEHTSELRTGIHLRAIAGKSPAEEYNIESENYFEGIQERFIESALEALTAILELDKLSDYKIFKPKNTRTYLMEESGDELVKKPILLSIFEEEDFEEEDDDNDEDDEINGNDQDGEINDDGENEENDAPKKGFFSKLFGKN